MAHADHADRGSTSEQSLHYLLEAGRRRLLEGLALVGTCYAFPAAAHAARAARRTADRERRQDGTPAGQEVAYLESLWEI